MGWHHSRPLRKGMWRDTKAFFIVIVPVWLICNKVYRGTWDGNFVVGKSTTPVVEQFGLPYDARPKNSAGFVGLDEREVSSNTANIR
jgi:hypothetical protein